MDQFFRSSLSLSQTYAGFAVREVYYIEVVHIRCGVIVANGFDKAVRGVSQISIFQVAVASHGQSLI